MEKSNKVSFPAQVLKPLEKYLKTEEKKLKVTKKELKKVDPFTSGNRGDDSSIDTDVAVDIQHDRAYAMKLQVSRSLVAVRKALTRIKLGKYGICVSCGKMIDTDRLAITPTADMCMECAKKAEKKLS